MNDLESPLVITRRVAPTLLHDACDQPNSRAGKDGSMVRQNDNNSDGGSNNNDDDKDDDDDDDKDDDNNNTQQLSLIHI